jgi:hypothetical protein
LSLLSLHLLTSIRDGGVVNIINVHSRFTNSVYYFLHAIARKFLLCIQVWCSCQLTSGLWHYGSCVHCAHCICCLNSEVQKPKFFNVQHSLLYIVRIKLFVKWSGVV